jgi:hypothetical protein
VALAAVAWSTAGVLQRQLTLVTSTQVFGRAVFAAGALLAYVALVDRGRGGWRAMTSDCQEPRSPRILGLRAGARVGSLSP